MEFFNFGVEQKLDQHFHAQFHSDSDNDGFKAQKRMIDPLIGLIDLNDPKNGIFKLCTRTKVRPPLLCRIS